MSFMKRKKKNENRPQNEKEVRQADAGDFLI
jgi:hypothetical protein